MSNKTELQNNNLELSEILGDINALPDAGGGAIETWGLTIHANGATGTECLIPYVDDNGEIQLFYGYDSLWEEHNFQVPKGSAIFLHLNNYSLTINYGSANFESISGFNTYNGLFYRITGDVELTLA